jgi:hypothetical protein
MRHGDICGSDYVTTINVQHLILYYGCIFVDVFHFALESSMFVN